MTKSGSDKRNKTHQNEDISISISMLTESDFLILEIRWRLRGDYRENQNPVIFNTDRISNLINLIKELQ